MLLNSLIIAILYKLNTMRDKIKHLLANIPRQQFLYYNKRQLINVVISCYEQVLEIVKFIDGFRESLIDYVKKTDFKTINNESIIGSGNIKIENKPKDGWTKEDLDKTIQNIINLFSYRGEDVGITLPSKGYGFERFFIGGGRIVAKCEGVDSSQSIKFGGTKDEPIIITPYKEVQIEGSLAVNDNITLFKDIDLRGKLIIKNKEINSLLDTIIPFVEVTKLTKYDYISSKYILCTENDIILNQQVYSKPESATFIFAVSKININTYYVFSEYEGEYEYLGEYDINKENPSDFDKEIILMIKEAFNLNKESGTIIFYGPPPVITSDDKHIVGLSGVYPKDYTPRINMDLYYCNNKFYKIVELLPKRMVVEILEYIVSD